MMGKVGMNSKLLLSVGVFAVAIIIVIAILTLEDKPQSSLTTEEINPLKDEYCQNNFVISLSTPKKFYFPGDDIIISGTINCTFNSKLAVPTDIPITLQMILNDDLIEIAQIEITNDGEFTHLVKAMGSQWQQSGTYTIKMFYGVGYAAETNFDFFADIDPRSKNELQVSRDLVLVGKTITVFGNISNPAAEYVIIRIFNENNGEMENIRKTLDDAGFYEHEIKIKSSWPVGTYSVSIMPSEFDSVVYFDVLGTEETWEETNKSIQNFP